MNKSNKKLWILLLVLLGCLVFGSGFMFGYMLQANNPAPTPTPTVTSTPSQTVSPTPTVTGSVTVTPSGTNPYADWQQYVLSDCQIKLYAPKDWIPGKRGEDGTCGSFRFPTDGSITSFPSFQDVALVFIPVATKGSPYSISTYGNNLTVAAYMKLVQDNAKNNSGSSDPNAHLLVSQGTMTIAGTQATEAKIIRGTLGLTDNVFYTAFGREYAIIWGGKNVSSQQQTVNLILQSIEYIQANGQ